jgi:hypothetical protein
MRSRGMFTPKRISVRTPGQVRHHDKWLVQIGIVKVVRDKLILTLDHGFWIAPAMLPGG